MESIVNKVEQSGIITVNLEELYDENSVIMIDIKDNLYMGLMLKEKEFRDYIKTHDWNQYVNKNIAIHCSSDAIVPTWAYMLIANKLSGIAKHVVFGSKEQLIVHLITQAIETLNLNDYIDKRVVIKGCGDKPIPVNAYVLITNKLTPVVKSLMFGEPCSTVPIYKKP